MMTTDPQPNRLPADRSNSITIAIDGCERNAHAGETIAAVLLAAGQRVFRRTRQTDEPRGPFCGMGVCYDCLVTVDGVPNVRACVTPIREGMRVETRSTFQVPGSKFEVRTPNLELRTSNFELAIVGAGPAGLEAAIAAAEADVKVVLIDSATYTGGNYFRPTANPTIKPSPRQQQAAELRQRLDASPVHRLTDTTVWGAFPAEDGGWLLALHGPDAPQHLHAQALILAPGAYDRPIAFPGWTLPGVLTAGAVQTLVKAQGVLPGQRFVFAGSGPLTWLAAAAVIKAGGEVAAVLEAQPLSKLARPGRLPAIWGQWERLGEGWRAWRTLRRAGVPLRFGWTMTAARGAEQVKAVDIARLAGDGRPIPATAQILPADTLVLGFGFLPSTQLTRLLGCAREYLPRQGGWVPGRDAFMQTSLPGVFAVGDGAGIGGAALVRLEGRVAGLAAAQQIGRISEQELAAALQGLRGDLARERRFAAWFGELFAPPLGLVSLADDDTIICRCEEVRLGDIRAAQAAGCSTLAEIKGLTRAGMGNCQGRICGELVAQAVARGDDLAALGQFSVRPPIHPLTVAQLAAAAE